MLSGKCNFLLTIKSKKMKFTDKINYWWMPVLAGVLLIAVSIFFISKPLSAFLGLTVLFGWLIFTNGGLNLIFAIRNRKIFESWIWYLLIGIFEILTGIVLLFNPQISAESLIIFAGFWLMYSAVSKISYSFVLKKSGTQKWWLTLISGIISLIFAFFMIANPIFGILGIVYLTSVTILISGITALIFGLQIKKLNKTF